MADYAEQILNVDRENENLLLKQRKGSCEKQWESLKKRFMKWKESGNKK